MATPIFPALIGVTWEQHKRPTWSTIKSRSTAGNEFRLTSRLVPITEFDLSFDYLSATDKYNLEGFFNAVQGSFAPFYYTATNDNTVSTPFQFGTGTGSQTAFAVQKPAGNGASEPVGGLATVTGVWINGISTSAYTFAGNTITFTTAPANATVLTWTGTYYYFCRFAEDALDFNQFAYNMWELRECKLTTVQ